MSTRIAYWTSSFEPEMEAISAEVAVLRRRFRSSVAWGMSPRHWAVVSWRRGFCLHPKMQLAFRAITKVLEPAFHLNHVFGSLGDWFYLRSVRLRPTVLTVAAHCVPVEQSMLDRVDRFVFETPIGNEQLTRLGVDPSRTRVVLPPVDLDRFQPSPPPEGRFKVLFASSPDRADWLEARGIPLILDAAQLRPDMQFRLLWRPWGDSLRRLRRMIAERHLTNVIIIRGRCEDMPLCFRAAHVTIAPFTRADRCKPAPNSIIESLASGRPVVTTRVVGLADMIANAGAGRACDTTGESLTESLERVQCDWQRYSDAARELAEQRFGQALFLREYQKVYGELT